MMVEGGAALITGLLHARLVDQVAICIAPKILGTGIEAIGDLGINLLSDALQLHDMNVERCGRDLIVTGRVVYPNVEHTDGG